MDRTIDLAEVLDRQKLGRPLLTIIVLCALVTLADGYNISAAGFAAPGIVKEWGLSRASLGPLFSSALLAGFIGPALFGTLAGRFGRRLTILAATVLFGVFGLLCAVCHSLLPIVECRFVAGMGMSGALAVTVANISEFAPRRLRATFVTLIFSGTTFGSGAIGLVAPYLLGHFGWQGIFVFGGVVTLLSAALVLLFLPESPKYLCLRPGRLPFFQQLAANTADGFRPALLACRGSGGGVSVRRHPWGLGDHAASRPLWNVAVRAALPRWALAPWRRLPSPSSITPTSIRSHVKKNLILHRALARTPTRSRRSRAPRRR